MKRILPFIVLCILLVRCSSDENSVPVIDLQKSGKAGVLKLSEIGRDYNLIRLESADSILIGDYVKYQISDRYIITVDDDKIMQFTGKGRFVRTVALAGKGPDEFYRVEAFAINEKTGTLYYNHRGDPYNINIYNLESGNRQKKIATGIENRITKMLLLNDTVLALVPAYCKDYNLILLSTSGMIIDGISPPEQKAFGLETSIFNPGNELQYMPKEYDTLFQIANNKKDALYYFTYDDRFTFENNETGNCLYISANAPDFMIAKKIHADIQMNNGGESFTMKGDKITSYWIKKADQSPMEIKGIYNDIYGFDEIIDPWDDKIRISNNYAFIAYDPPQLIRLLKEALESNRLDSETMQRATSLYNKLNENDNPVLITWKL